MNMKKLMAGIAASALAVTSLATVNVFAEDSVREFSFNGTSNTLTFKYDKTYTYLEAISPSQAFLGKVPTAAADENGIDGWNDVQLKGAKFTNVFKAEYGGVADGYTADETLVKALKDVFAGQTYGTDTTVTVTGTKVDKNDKEGKVQNVTVKATAGKDQGYTFNIRVRDDGGSYLVQANDLDLTDVITIKSIQISGSFSVGIGAININPDWAVGFNAIPTMTIYNKDGEALEDWQKTSYWCSTYKAGTANASPVLVAGNIYTFEGDREEGPFVLIKNGYGVNGATSDVYAQSLGSNLLRWTNDNIIQNKGAKLRITFMTPQNAQEALSRGDSYVYDTIPSSSAASSVLIPPSTSGTDGSAMDIMIGVNLPNTSKLQQAANIVDNVAEFDWDTLVQNSTSTVSGNVDSIAIRLNPLSANVAYYYGNQLTIDKIEIVIPDQATVPGADNDKVISLTAGEPDANVKVIGTIGTLYGNGAQDLTVVANVTATSVSYTLKLTDASGNYVQPAGEVTLQMSIPSKVTKVTSDKVKHTCNDGTVEELTIENYATCMTDGYVVVKTSKFSSFEFEVETDEDQVQTEATTTEAPVTEATEAPSANNGNANPGTGVALAVIPAIVAAAGVVISKKRG